jgi:hypothetical protein
MSIVYTPESVEISLAVAAALLAFASDDETRPHLGVGIDHGALCATDGHRAVLFAGDAPTSMQSKVWAAKHVEVAAKVARAHKAKTVVLRFADCITAPFPPLSRVVPTYGVSARGPIGFNPSYVGDIAKVCKACGTPNAKLTQAKGDLDPLGFVVEGNGLTARAVVMPARI